ncbi:MAG: hypothetical protein O7D86_11225, partial [Proteobacteria bacterium]|nr:hypothetical protein [Pseudomonadota bacterium]
QPLVNTEVIAMAELVGEYSSASFHLRTLDGELLRDIPLLQGEEVDLPSSVFSGRFSVPSEGFRLYVSGENEAGEQFTRVFPRAIKAQLVGVNLALSEGLSVKVGESTSFNVVVQNFGPSAVYRIDVVDEFSYISGVSDNVISLESDESKEVTISVTVPEGAPEGLNTIIISATNTANPEVNNTARLAMNVFDITDTDGDGIIDEEDSCPNSNLDTTVVIESCDSGAANILAEAGCTLSDLVDAASGSKNHGSFVSAVTKIASDAKSLELISGRDYGKIISCAAKSGIE